MAGSLRLTRIGFRAGPRPGAPPLELEPSSVVVLIGPNNAGKSLALREVEAWCFGEDRPRRVVGDLSVDLPDDPDHALDLLRPFATPLAVGEQAVIGQFEVNQYVFRGDLTSHKLGLRDTDIRYAVEERREDLLRRYLVASYTARLDGRTRFSLAGPQNAGDLQRRPENHLWALFQDDAARDQVRGLTAAAFGLHFVVDPTDIGRLRIRMSPRPPAESVEEQGLDARARAFHAQAPLIEDLGDGVQAFTGLVAAVVSLPHRILLVDEPEAFLHPPLARRLGGALAGIARERGESLLVATHSADFLLGCLEAVADTSVVRLGYESGVATARSLAAADLTELARDPLLRSTDVLRALFHRAAVIAEADADRAFYDEVNRRLVAEGRGVADALFLNAQGKDTIHRIVGPLRRIGIPAAAVVDLDVLNGGAAWSGLLAACRIPEPRRPRLHAERVHIAHAFAAAPPVPGGGKALKRRGVDALEPADRARAEALLTELAAHGLFLVPGGELETWLPSLGVPSHGNDWLVELFARIGASPDAADYLRPDRGDVWGFLDGVAAWVSDPARLGME